jgi:hypothetical protein
LLGKCWKQRCGPLVVYVQRDARERERTSSSDYTHTHPQEPDGISINTSASGASKIRYRGQTGDTSRRAVHASLPTSKLAERRLIPFWHKNRGTGANSDSGMGKEASQPHQSRVFNKPLRPRSLLFQKTCKVVNSYRISLGKSWTHGRRTWMLSVISGGRDLAKLIRSNSSGTGAPSFIQPTTSHHRLVPFTSIRAAFREKQILPSGRSDSLSCNAGNSSPVNC